jgi:lysophospholipase L1-like esterase
VLATAPPASTQSIAAIGVDAPDRVEAYNEVVRRVAARAGSGVVLVDVGGAVAADPDRYPRDDGVHFSSGEGSVAVVVDLLAPALGEIAAR